MENKKENKSKDNNEEKFGIKFLNTIKKRWLITRTNTLLLIAILIAIVVLINSIVQSLDLTPIDCTSNKQYTLTEESKERISKIEDSVSMYFVGYEDSDAIVALGKQYKKENDKINVETIDVNERKDFASEHTLTSNAQTIIIECGERTKTITAAELYTYDDNYNQIDVTEEQLTSGLINVTITEIPNVYILSGFSDYKLDASGGMYLLSNYLEKEVLNYNSLDMLNTGTIPEDCDTLVILTPTQDFDELTANKIIEYINRGGNILWLNASYAQKQELNNVNKVLEVYGINPFDAGYIYETDTNKTVLGYVSCIIENLGGTEIDSKLSRIVLLNPTKINVNTDKLEELGVEKQDIISTSDTAYFRTNVSSTSSSAIDGDEKGEYIIGGIFTKTLSKNEETSTENSEEELKSQLVIIGDNNFVSDIQINSQIQPMLYLEDNKDLMLNSIAYLTDQDESITIRKDYTSISSFTATDKQKAVIMKIVFMIPIGIILFGFVVWQVRKRKK